MRALYDPASDTPTDPKAFQGTKELQHHLSAEIGHKLRGEDGYPDDVLIAILSEKATYYGIASELAYAFASATRNVQTRLV